MVGRARTHLQSNIVGYLALFVALGGTSYAAVSLPNNSVGTKQLRNGAVTASKVKAHSLTRTDFRRGQIPAGPRGLQGTTGSTGLQGAQGLQGIQGPKGDQGIPGSARAYGQVVIDGTGNYALVPGTSKNVVSLTQGGGGNPAACIQLDPSIDASTATLIATPNNRTGSSASWNATAFEERPLGYCSGSNIVEVDTSLSNSPGAAVKSAFAFMVP
jgi:hypothetical protein